MEKSDIPPPINSDPPNAATTTTTMPAVNHDESPPPSYTGSQQMAEAEQAALQITPIPNAEEDRHVQTSTGQMTELDTPPTITLGNNDQGPEQTKAVSSPMVATAATPAPAPVVQRQQQQLMVTPLERLGEQPAWVDCPFCRQRRMTRVSEVNSSQTNIAAGLCCLFCGLIGVCIPYAMGWCQDVQHFCTGCGAQVAVKTHDGPVQVIMPASAIQVPSKAAGVVMQQPGKYS